MPYNLLHYWHQPRARQLRDTRPLGHKSCCLTQLWPLNSTWPLNSGFYLVTADFACIAGSVWLVPVVRSYWNWRHAPTICFLRNSNTAVLDLWKLYFTSEPWKPYLTSELGRLYLTSEPWKPYLTSELGRLYLTSELWKLYLTLTPELWTLDLCTLRDTWTLWTLEAQSVRLQIRNSPKALFKLSKAVSLQKEFCTVHSKLQSSEIIV